MTEQIKAVNLGNAKIITKGKKIIPTKQCINTWKLQHVAANMTGTISGKLREITYLLFVSSQNGLYHFALSQKTLGSPLLA